MRRMTTPRDVPVLELREARPALESEGLLSSAYDLRLMPGECALIRSRDTVRAGLFADLCTGMVGLRGGSVRCQGLDWTAMEERERWALRGRIGRVSQVGSWVDLFGTHFNILTPVLHHTRIPTEQLIAEATELAVRFGLPGLPVQAPGRLSPLDLRRAALVRAFLGEPALLILEDPVEVDMTDLLTPFLGMLTQARDRGAAVLWITRSAALWGGYRDAATSRYRLIDEGLFPMRGA